MSNTISLWASRNVFIARFSLILLHTLLGCIAYALGLLFSEGIEAPWYLSAVVLLLMASFLQVETMLRNRRTALKHCLMLSLRVLFWLLIGVQFVNYAVEKKVEKQAATTNTVMSSMLFEKGVEMKKGTNSIIFKIEKRFKALIIKEKELVEDVASSEIFAKMVLIVILALLVAAAIGYLTFFISCNLSCSGQEAFGLVIVILGAAAVLSTLYLFTNKLLLLSKEYQKARQREKKTKVEKVPKKKEEKKEVIPPKKSEMRKKTAKELKEEYKAAMTKNGIFIGTAITLLALILLAFSLNA